MAEKLPDFIFKKNRLGRKSQYPWEQWLNGDIWKLEKGKDFHVDIKSFRAALYARVRDNGLKLRNEIRDNNTVIIIQVFMPEVENKEVVEVVTQKEENISSEDSSSAVEQEASAQKIVPTPSTAPKRTNAKKSA